jgi:RNA polymerase sigma-70 factor (ECF subfamily)
MGARSRANKKAARAFIFLGCVRIPVRRDVDADHPTLMSMRTASIASAMPDLVARHDNADERPRFDRLIEPLLGEAFALALALSADRGSAQDAVQNAAFKAWRRMPQLREEGSVRSWFLTIVVHECRSTWRKRKASTADVDGRIDPINWPLGVEQQLDVRMAMRQMKRDDRVILSLRFLMDMSVEESAAMLGISVSAVKARTARAAARFRAVIAPQEGAE